MKNGKKSAIALVLYNIDPVREARLKRGKLIAEGAEMPRMYPHTLTDAMRRAGFTVVTDSAYENLTYGTRLAHGYNIVVADVGHACNGELADLQTKIRKARQENGGKRISVLLIGEEFSAAVRNQSPFKRFMNMERGLDAIAQRAYAIATWEPS